MTKRNEQYNGAVLLEMFKSMTAPEIARATGLTLKTVEYRIRAERVKPQPRLSNSPMPVYNDPLSVTGDVLVLNDLEVPFHHAPFVNKCLDLAQSWGITQLILGGDFLHFETFSAWGAAWKDEAPQTDAISEEREKRLRAIAETLTGEAREALEAEIAEMVENRTGADDEIKSGAKTLKTLAQIFKDIYCVIGNHDDRFLRIMNKQMTPQKLLDFMGLTDKAFHIKPYYFCELTSGGERWRIEHQKGAGLPVAIKMADKYDCHSICAHNHLQALNWSYNGKHYAISSGHAVDESRLAYAQQRSNNAPAHNLGAVIVRDGRPYLLNERVDWAALARM